MLNQYYNFLANRLVDWIESKKDYKVAEKYFVLLEDEKEADVFYRTLKELQYTNKIEFYSDQYNYRTVGILKKDKKFIFVAPVDGVTQDFLVTIRNRVNENRDEWEDTCVIFIVFNPLDSIIGGSYDLTQKSAPFNGENIRYHIEKNISSNTKMKEYEKKILNHYLQEITENTNSSLKDYEIIFTILENESLSERDYSNLGYFYDNVLDTFKDEKNIDERLNKNREYFDKIENIHSFSSHKDEVDEKVEHLVSGEIIKKLTNDEKWKAVYFKDVNQGIVDYMELNDSKIEFSDNNFLIENTNYWIRLLGDTTSKRKTMYIVTTNDRFKEEGLKISFTEQIKNRFIEAKQTYILDSQSNIYDIDTSISKDTLIIKYPELEENETYAGRVRYIHNNKKRLTFNIIFMILPFDIEEINRIKPNFEIKVRKGKKDFYLDLSSDLENYVFGKDDVENINFKSIVDGDLHDIKNKELIILETDDFFEMLDTNMVLNTYYGQFYFPIALNDIIPKSVPKSEITIERYRLRSNNHLHYRDNKILTGSQFISIVDDLKRNLEIESFMLKEFALNIDVYGDEIIKNEVELDEELFDLYANLINYYLDEDTLPSLAANTDEHINMMKLILDKIEDRFDNIEENHKLDYSVKHILQLGVIRKNKDYILTPLNPLIIAYNVELYESLLNSYEVPKEQILSTLNPEYLVPYLMIDNIQYKASYTKKEPTWLRYKKIENRQISDLGKNIITQRLEDFSKQYKYLFESNNHLSINIAAFNIVDEKNFFEAIIDYMIGLINRSDDIYDINPVNIYFDNLTVQLKSLFGNLYEMRNLEELEKQLGKSIKTNISSDTEVLEVLKIKINMYKMNARDMDKLNKHFHITFYQLDELKEININKNYNLSKNYTLNGLVSNPQYTKDGDKYVNGFGLSDYKEENPSNLIEFVEKLNSILASINTSSDLYQSDNVLVNYIPTLEYSELKPIIDNSSWVTFLNLNIDLSYFFDESNGEMLVIHYTDQTTTSVYESVTVTNDIKQYDYLIKEALPSTTVNKKYFDTKEIIKNFNVLNGQWLLKLISNDQDRNKNRNYLREKLSIISAYKIMLGLLDHPDFIWIPISLEEILRVSGMVGLSQKEGLFSTKTLGKSGVTSDDLLFMGIEVDTQTININLLPIEVKVGINSSVENKAINQVKHTSKILNEFLTEENENEFMRNYYINLFISIMVTNLNKMISSNLYTKYDEIILHNIINKLKAGEFTINNNIVDYYGDGVVFKFTEGQSFRKSKLLEDQNIRIIEVPEIDAYDLVSEPINTLIADIRKNKYDFSKDIILSNVYNIDDFNYNDKSSSNEKKDNEEYELFKDIEQNVAEEIYTDEDSSFTESKEKNNITVIENITKSIEDIRFLIGANKDSNSKLYWEYGNKKLSNRHMIITGKSGQGKTYFIQTLLSEFANNGLDVLILDYTDGFTLDQLEKGLLDKHEKRIDIRYIYSDKLPINPFKRQKIKLGNIEIEEDIGDMIDRIEQTLDFVFNLGVQQRTVLADSIKEGYEIYGENYTFSHLRNYLNDEEDSSKKNLYGRIRPLLEKDPFSYDSNFDWGNIFTNKGKIHIYQFTGLQSDIQFVLLEFLLWDIFEYSKINTESKPIPIVLDEIQNLSFNKDSPVVKILREGRKYGLSGVFATQSLESIKGDDSEAIYNAAEQIHFLPPDNQVGRIAKITTSDNELRKIVETDLKKLHKGEALIYGPVLNTEGKLTPPEINSAMIDSFENRNG